MIEQKIVCLKEYFIDQCAKLNAIDFNAVKDILLESKPFAVLIVYLSLNIINKIKGHLNYKIIF